MRYDRELGIIKIGVREFCDIARRCISGVTPFLSEDETRTAKNKDTVSGCAHELSSSINFDGIEAEICGAPDSISDGVITLHGQGRIRGGKPSQKLRSQVRGELFVYGYMYLESSGGDEVTLSACYKDSTTGELLDERETVGKNTLLKFFEKCKKTLSVYARPEVDRVTVRLPSMKNARFPFDAVRDGQSELVRAVYRSLAKGNTLFAEAPTGTGKTVSVIYPAIKALGDGRCDKVFYLTPKTTTAKAAEECLELLTLGGCIIRAVKLTAKEKICTKRLACKDATEPCPLAENRAMADAVMALYTLGKTVIGKEDIIEASERYMVCPHELSLCYSELCDFIICDVNYVFDPVVYLKRYFDEGGRYALLVDEAHNLEGRAREMYSAELVTPTLSMLADNLLLGEHSNLKGVCREAAEEIYNLFFPYLADDCRKNENGEVTAAAHLSEIPSDMYTIIYNLANTAESELYRAYAAKDAEAPMRVKLIRDFYYDIMKFSKILDTFSDGYRILLFLEGDALRIKLFCIDTAEVLGSRLSKARGAVFFSATLEPVSYYSRALGGDSSSDYISVRSPFSPESLSVTIMDKISTRYSERERTQDAVCRVIAGTMSARRGHYMVFAPSFEYSEAPYRAFSAKYPKIKCLLQSSGMTEKERSEFLLSFEENSDKYLVGFCVMGGIYSEGIDLAGNSLIGAVIVGIGMPSLSYEREAIADYYQDKLDEGKQFAYIYPGMNKVFQAAGRVIRREDDRGVIVLIDDRFADPIYKKSIPALWRGMQYCSDAKELKAILDEFWAQNK